MKAISHVQQATDKSPGTDCVRDSVLGGQVVNSLKDCPKTFKY